MDIVKVSIMGICGMMLGFILKETRPEFAALVTMQQEKFLICLKP